jgi:hypothetical protein
MLPSFSKLRIGGATGVRTPARVGVAIPCDALDAGEGEDEGEIDKRAWAHIKAHPELEDMVTLESLADGYVVDDHWAKWLWYRAPDGDKRVVDLPKGWHTGPTAIIRVSPFCTDANGQKFAEYVLKGTLLASFAHQRYDPVDVRELRPFPEAYQVPGGTGRDTLVPKLNDPNYGEMLGILERFLDECEGIVVNPKMPDGEQRPLYNRSRDQVGSVYDRRRGGWRTGNPSNPFPSWLGTVEDGTDDSSEDEEEQQQEEDPGRRGGEPFLRAVEDLEMAFFPTDLMKAHALDAASDIARAWNRSDRVRDYLLYDAQERFFRAIGQTGLYALFVNGDPSAQQESIINFWYTITGAYGSKAVLGHLKNEFGVGVDSPIEMWYRFAPEDTLDQEFDDGTTLRKRALTFVSDMLWEHERPRSFGGFVQNARELTDAEVRDRNEMDTTIADIEHLVGSIESTLKTSQGVLRQIDIDRLTFKLGTVVARFKDVPFEGASAKQRRATLVFKAGLETHKAIHFANLPGQALAVAKPMLVKFHRAMLAVVEAVDEDRDGRLPERANQYTVARFFWEFIVPLDKVWTAYGGERRKIEIVLFDLLIQMLPERPGVQSLPAAAPSRRRRREGAGIQTHDEIMDGIIQGGGFANFPNIQNAPSRQRYDVYKARIATVNQELRTLGVMVDAEEPYDPDVIPLGVDVRTLADETGEVAFPSIDQFLETAISIVRAAHTYALLYKEHIEFHADILSPDFLAATKLAFTSLLKRIVRRTIRYTRFLDDNTPVNQISFGWFLEVVVGPFDGGEDVIDEMEAMYMPHFAPPGEDDDWDGDASTESDSESEFETGPPTPQALMRARSSGEVTPGRRRQRTDAAV